MRILFLWDVPAIEVLRALFDTTIAVTQQSQAWFQVESPSSLPGSYRRDCRDMSCGTQAGDVLPETTPIPEFGEGIEENSPAFKVVQVAYQTLDRR